MANLGLVVKITNSSNPTYTETVSATANTTRFVPQATVEADDPFFEIKPLPSQQQNKRDKDKKRVRK